MEEHRRAALIALLVRNYGTGPRYRSQSPTPSDSTRGSFEDRRDTAQEGTTELLRIPPDISPESLAAIQEFVDLIHGVNTSKNTEALSEPCTPSPVQQAGPPRIETTPPSPSTAFSQYSIHPDSPESSDLRSVTITTTSKPREPNLPPPSLKPSRKIRSFKASAHSQGYTIWMTTVSFEGLSNPPEPTPEDGPGVLYVHRNLTDNTLQVWLMGSGGQWAPVPFGVATQHPIFGDRYLAIRLNGTPSWVTINTWCTAKKWVDRSL